MVIPSNATIQGENILLTVKTSIYPLEVIYSAAYILLDHAYVVLDGNPKSEIIVSIQSKGSVELLSLAHDFNNQLLNYAVYKTQSDGSKDIKKILLQRALLTNLVEPLSQMEFEQSLDQPIKDPERIAVPHGNKNSSVE